MNQSKVKLVFSGCQDTFSGYGFRSKDFLKSLIKLKGEEYDIKVLSQRWGNTPFGSLDPSIPADKAIIDRTIPQLTEQPDIFIMCSVPNEMPQQRVGKYLNIVLTAGVETSIMPAELIQGANNADLVIVSSEHAKKVFESSTFEQIDNRTQQKVADLKLTKPCEVLFEGADLSVFDYKGQYNFDLSMVKEDFAFLSVGHALSGFEQLEDRKNLGILIKTFLETFKHKRPAPALILKTSLGGYSITEEEQLLDKIDVIRKTVGGSTFPNIYIIHGELTDHEMSALYNHPKVKAFALVSNEGYGRPHLEFGVASSKPIICGSWSGYTDFLFPDFSVFVGGSLQPVPKSVQNQFLIEGSQFFRPDPHQLSIALKDVYENYKNYIDRGKRQGYRCRTEFSLDKMTEKLDTILKQYTPMISRPVPISLPKLARPLTVPTAQ